MADLGVAIRTHLLTKSAVTDLVGTRIYPAVFPEGVTFPAVRYTMVSQFRESVVSGNSGIVEAGVQVDTYAATHIQSNQIGEAIRDALQNFSGSAGTVHVWSVTVTGGSELYETPLDADDEGLYRVINDYQFMFEESVPTH
jgi:hypothetical protein